MKKVMVRISLLNPFYPLYPVLPLYRNYPIDCSINQWTSFYIMVTLALMAKCILV